MLARPDSTRHGKPTREKSQKVRKRQGKNYPPIDHGVWSRQLWSLAARLAVIPWSLVAHTNNKNK